MKKVIGFICAILITIFAIMPNVYAEAEKDYGNLDMNRWVVIGRSEEKDLLIDKETINYKLNFKEDLLCNLWVCHFINNEDIYTLENITLNYDEKTLSIDSYASYNKNGILQDSYTYPYQEFDKIIPESMGEAFYIALFPKDKISDIKNYAKQKQ